MLYISRYIGQTKYGVVDSDDGVETVCTYADLMDYVLKMGLDIKGVVLTTNYSRGKPRQMIKNVNVYQNQDFVTREQAKMKVLGGVDVKTFDNQIVSITISPNGLQNKVELRLSDYGTTCGEYIFSRISGVRDGKLVIILDDNILLNSKSLKYFSERGIIVNTTEVTSRKMVEYVARELATGGRWLSITAFDSVIDVPNRMDYYKGVTILCRETNYDPQITHISDIVSNSVVLNRVIAKKFKSEFAAIAKANYASIRNLRWITLSKNYSKWVISSQAQELLARGNFDGLRSSRFIELFASMRELSTCNKNVLVRFENYIKFFDATPEIKQSFVTFCRRATDWLVDLARAQHWI